DTRRLGLGGRERRIGDTDGYLWGEIGLAFAAGVTMAEGKSAAVGRPAPYSFPRRSMGPDQGALRVRALAAYISLSARIMAAASSPPGGHIAQPTDAASVARGAPPFGW